MIQKRLKINGLREKDAHKVRTILAQMAFRCSISYSYSKEDTQIPEEVGPKWRPLLFSQETTSIDIIL